jgi:hypothetical protein
MDLLIRDNPGPPSDNGSARLFIISIVFAVLASVAVAGRLASRLSLKKSLGLDDLAIIVSLVSSPTCSFFMGFLHRGLAPSLVLQVRVEC